jgi:hypothetical protein
MNNDEYQATLEAGLRSYTRGAIVFTAIAAPFAFVMHSIALSAITGVLICLAAVVLLASHWAVES